MLEIILGTSGFAILFCIGMLILYVFNKYKNQCKHDWVEINQLKRSSPTGRHDRFWSIVYIQQCSKCKTIRKFEID